MYFESLYCRRNFIQGTRGESGLWFVLVIMDFFIMQLLYRLYVQVRVKFFFFICAYLYFIGVSVLDMNVRGFYVLVFCFCSSIVSNLNDDVLVEMLVFLLGLQRASIGVVDLIFLNVFCWGGFQIYWWFFCIRFQMSFVLLVRWFVNLFMWLIIFKNIWILWIFLDVGRLIIVAILFGFILMLFVFTILFRNLILGMLKVNLLIVSVIFVLVSRFNICCSL